MNSFEAFPPLFASSFSQPSMIDNLTQMRDIFLNQLAQELSFNRILISNSFPSIAPYEATCPSPPTKV